MNRWDSGEQPDAKDGKVTQKTQNDPDLSVEDRLSRQIIGAAVEVQRELGVGLLESAYRRALVWELRDQELDVETEVEVQGTYKGQDIGLVYRADLIVEGLVVVELKAIDATTEAHRAQLLTYLRLTDRRLGLLLNFGEFPVAKSAKRMVNRL